MMTGKYLRPLLRQGLGGDSETLAGLPARLRLPHRGVLPAGGLLHRRASASDRFRDRRLDFEYARVEFADPPRASASWSSAYLGRAGADHRLFLWVHLFEPHEPYVAHAEHPFGDRDVDRYDSEIAAADDGIGEIVSAGAQRRRPNAVVIVTADHGEEFGEHGGRYHGTTVYEEQVRVPLVVATPGLAPRRVETPVQTIDLLPTVLSALDIPRPPGSPATTWERSCAGAPPQPETAFAETDEQTLLADAEWRLVCARRVGACALYNLDLDPGETRDASAAQPERFAAMKGAMRRLEAAHGRYERGEGGDGGSAKPWPEPDSARSRGGRRSGARDCRVARRQPTSYSGAKQRRCCSISKRTRSALPRSGSPCRATTTTWFGAGPRSR